MKLLYPSYYVGTLEGKTQTRIKGNRRDTKHGSRVFHRQRGLLGTACCTSDVTVKFREREVASELDLQQEYPWFVMSGTRPSDKLQGAQGKRT